MNPEDWYLEALDADVPNWVKTTYRGELAVRSVPPGQEKKELTKEYVERILDEAGLEIKNSETGFDGYFMYSGLQGTMEHLESSEYQGLGEAIRLKVIDECIEISDIEDIFETLVVSVSEYRDNPEGRINYVEKVVGMWDKGSDEVSGEDIVNLHDETGYTIVDVEGDGQPAITGRMVEALNRPLVEEIESVRPEITFSRGQSTYFP